MIALQRSRIADFSPPNPVKAQLEIEHLGKRIFAKTTAATQKSSANQIGKLEAIAQQLGGRS